MTAGMRNPGAGEMAMKRAPKILKKRLLRVTIRSLTAVLNPNWKVRNEYMAGKRTTRMKKLATELSGMRKLDYS
jgi:hypothetical protein